MVFLGLTLYSRIMNTNPLSFLVQNNWIPCRPCRFHVPSALSLVQGFEINLYIFYILKWLGTQSKYLKIFFFAKQHHQTKTHLFDPFCGGWTSVFCLVIDLRMPISTNSWIATLRAIKVQVDQSWTKRPEGVFLGWNVALKQHQKLGTNMLCRFWSVWSFCPKQENRWTGRAFTRTWSWKQFWSTLFWQWLVHMAQRETEGYKFGSNI